MDLKSIFIPFFLYHLLWGFTGYHGCSALDEKGGSQDYVLLRLYNEHITLDHAIIQYLVTEKRYFTMPSNGTISCSVKRLKKVN